MVCSISDLVMKIFIQLKLEGGSVCTGESSFSWLVLGLGGSPRLNINWGFSICYNTMRWFR